jgi:hypothetical protein
MVRGGLRCGGWDCLGDMDRLDRTFAAVIGTSLGVAVILLVLAAI